MGTIKTKKLFLQYSYLSLEKEEVVDICKKTEIDIRKYMEENFKEEYHKIYGPTPSKSKKNETTNKTPEDMSDPKEEVTTEDDKVSEKQEPEDIIQPTKKKQINSDVKILYRKIVEVTHPDKIGSDIYAGVFSAATSAYKGNNILELVKIAASLDIFLSDFSIESISLMEKNVNYLEKEILIKKSTVAWAWSQAETDEKKNELAKIILNNSRR